MVRLGPKAVGAALLGALLLSSCGRAPDATEALPPGATVHLADQVELVDSEALTITATGSNRRYPVWVSLPAGYAADPKRRFPVLFVTDAAYSFPLIHSIRNFVGQNGANIEDFILVGLPPQEGLTAQQGRARDYTPSSPATRGDDYGPEAYGEAAVYRDLLEAQVFPLIAARYRADMNRRIFVGHALGGLLGSYILLTRPQMFHSYILCSPSLWFDDHVIDRLEADYAKTHEDLDAQVLFYVGGYETRGSGPRNNRRHDVAGDTRRFAAQLDRRRYPSLSLASQMVDDEDHLTVFPPAITRALVRTLPGRGPYTGG